MKEARELGTMISRKQKELSEKDIAKISDTYHNWRSKADFETKYKDIAGFCKSANIQDVHKNNYILTPGRYIDFKEVAEDGIAFDEKMQMLSATLTAQMQKANELHEAIKLNLTKIGYEL
jgi:type I restriction enzyme M protein